MTMMRATILAGLLAGTSTGMAQEVVRVVPATELSKYWRVGDPILPKYVRLAFMTQLEGCYAAEFAIDSSGSVSDARIVESHVSLERKQWAGIKRRDVARVKAEAIEQQALAVLEAVRASSYSPAEGNPGRVAVRTRTAPIVLSMVSLENPGDRRAVAREHKAQQHRRDLLLLKCSPASEATPG